MGEARTPRVLGELIDDRGKRLGDRIFLRFKDQTFTYDEIRRYSNRCAHAFKNLGIGKGDKVSIMLPNLPEFLHIWFGLAKIGAVEVPVNTSYKGEFLRHVVDQSDSHALGSPIKSTTACSRRSSVRVRTDGWKTSPRRLRFCVAGRSPKGRGCL